MSLSASKQSNMSQRARRSLPELGQVRSNGFRRASLQDRASRKSESVRTKERVEEGITENSNCESSHCESGKRMYIIVKYANNRSLIVNPMCSVVNLLSSIKSRTGHEDNKEMLIDLSDETGLIQDLEVHGREYATKFLSSPGTYILMKKEVEGGPETALTIQSYNYIPLLDSCTDLYPNFKVHLSEAQKKKLKPPGKVNKHPSPAGKMPTTKGGSVGQSSRSLGGRAPRSGSRGRSTSKH